jgi:hypothetical protein
MSDLDAIVIGAGHNGLTGDFVNYPANAHDISKISG